MAKKPSSKRSLKSLFSRSEASLDGAAEKDADKPEGDKKNFKLFKIKTKSKSSSAPEKAAAEEQQALRYVCAAAAFPARPVVGTLPPAAPDSTSVGFQPKVKLWSAAVGGVMALWGWQPPHYELYGLGENKRHF